MPRLRSSNCSSESKENSYNPNILTIVSVLEILSPMSLTIQQQLHKERGIIPIHPICPCPPSATEKAAQQSGWFVRPFSSNSFPSPTCPICLSSYKSCLRENQRLWFPLFFPPRDLFDSGRNREQVYGSSERCRQPRSLPAHMSRIPRLPPPNYSCLVLWDSLPIFHGSLTHADQIAGCADVYWNGFYIQIGHDLKSLYNLFSGKPKIFPSL